MLTCNTTVRAVWAAFALALMTASGAHGAEAGASLKLKVTEKALDIASPANITGNVVISHDNRHVAYVTRTLPPNVPLLSRIVRPLYGDRIVVDGKKSRAPAFMHADTLVLSDTGGRFGYTTSGPGKDMVVIDGREFACRVAWPDTVAFSPDGKRVTWRTSGTTATGSAVCVDKVAGKSYRSIQNGPVWSPGGGILAYVARIGDGVVVVGNGAESPEYESLEPSVFGEGPFAGYRIKAGGGEYVFIVAEPLRPGQLSGPDRFVFSPDGKRLAYTARKGRPFVVVDGVKGRAYDFINWGTLTFSADSEHYGYIANDEGENVVVVDGRELHRNTTLGWNGLLLSRDGKRTAVHATHLDGEYVIVDNWRGGLMRM